MAMDYRADSPRILLEFLSYHETVKAHSQKTVDEYYLDLRNFLRYIKQLREPELSGYELDQIDIRDIGIEFIRSITLTATWHISAVSGLSGPTAKILPKVFRRHPGPGKSLHFVHFLTIYAIRYTYFRKTQSGILIRRK